MNAYFDNNIVVDIEKEKISVSDLINRIDGSIDEIFYSSAHIFEADEISADTMETRNQRINKRMETIERITNSNYLSSQENDVFKVKEKPANVLATIREVPIGTKAMKVFTNIIDEDQRKQIRTILGLDPNRLNNYEPEDILIHLNKNLKSSGYDLSFIELIEKSVALNPQGKYFGLHNRIAGFFELLDMLGYWTDKYDAKSNYSRLWDASHTFFASYCDYFISDDKKTRLKAEVVYKYYKKPTIIRSSNGEK